MVTYCEVLLENKEAALATAPDADAAPFALESEPESPEPPEPEPEPAEPDPAAAPPEPVAVPLRKGGFGLEGDVAFEFSGAGEGFLGPDDVELEFSGAGVGAGFLGPDDVEFDAGAGAGTGL